MVGVMPNDPDPIPVGTEGTVTGGSEPSFNMAGQIWVEWDNGRSLILLTTDPYTIVR